MAAEIPSTSPDVLIVESTYGVQVCIHHNIHYLVLLSLQFVLVLLLLLLPMATTALVL
jgi:hypothetical protein